MTDTAPGPGVRSGTARSGELDIYYEDMGDVADPPILLVMGLGAQLIVWPAEFCERLVARGFRVIRYDNRDVGLSSKLDGRHTGAGLWPRMARSVLGLRSPAVYTLEDMAEDAVAVLDHLDVGSAHVVGASMGGMIAQIVAARHPQRTRTLGVIFSSNNQALLPPPGWAQLRAITTRPADTTREGIIANGVRVTGLIGSPGYPSPPEEIRRDVADAYDRCYYPAGVARHFSAVMGSGSLLAYDREITVPTVVIHGRSDKLMRPTGGRAVAKAIRQARLVLIDGMGHDLPEPLWDRVIGELATTFAQAP